MSKVYKCFSETNSLIFFIICKLDDSRNMEFLDILFDLKLKIQLVPESTLSKMDERVQKVYNIYCVEEDSFDAVEFSLFLEEELEQQKDKTFLVSGSDDVSQFLFMR